MIGRGEEEGKDIRRRWGVLFQGGALFSTLTVAENVQVPIREYYPNIGETLLDEIASYKIVMSGLPADAGPKFPSELSRSEEHTSELQSLMRISYAVFCLKKTTKQDHNT